MSAVNYPVTGVPKQTPAPADGSVPLRLEIRELQKNADQWNLYMLGLSAFKNSGETGDLSYYGIAGIHGRPYRPWGGVKGQNIGGWQGYCTHTSILFAPWHRPYLALYEQILYGIIQGIASQFPPETAARYQAAAANFRMPYWDWAAAPPNNDFFPDSVGGTPNVAVITPTSGGEPVAIANPLYTFKFHPVNPVPGDFIRIGRTPFDKWPTTLRYPTSTTSLNAVSQNDQVELAMASQFAGLQQNVNILLNDPNYQEFAAFSNHAWLSNSGPSTYASLEDVHNSIHGMVGGNMGHMAELDYSAFDPVFWLHHTNVDRLFAIWQALNPTSYTINKPTEDGTFVIQANSIETATTPLAPFADATGTNYWTSEGVRNTATFNYAYPEIQAWKFQSTSAYQNSVANAVDALYGGLSSQLTGDDSPLNFMSAQSVAPAKEIAAPAQKPIAEAPAPAPAPAAATPDKGFHPFKDLANKMKDALHHSPRNTDGTRGGPALDLEAEIGKPDLHPAPAKPGSYTEYIVNIKAPKHILGQSYRVHVFLGEFDPELKTWHTQDALVGTFDAFGKDTTPGSETETGCGKCKSDAAAECIVTGTIPLTSQIIGEIKKGNCPSLEKENVLPFLTKNLHWRVTLADGEEKSRDEVPGLILSVVTTEVSLPVGGRPVYSGVYAVHPEVTQGRPAGYSGPAVEAGPHTAS